MELCADCNDMFELKHPEYLYQCEDCKTFVCDDCLELTMEVNNNKFLCCAMCMEARLCCCKEGEKHTCKKLVTVKGKKIK